MKNSILFRRLFPILLAIALLFGVSFSVLAAGGAGGENAGIQPNMAGTGFQIRLSDPDTTMSNEGGTYALEKIYNPEQDIVFTFSLNPNGGRKGFGIYPALNGEPAGFDGVIVYDKSDESKTPVLSLGGNYSEDTMNANFFFEETYDAAYPDHLVFNMSTNVAFVNEYTTKLTIKAGSLEYGKTYCLYFPNTIKTFNNGTPKQLGSDVTIEFATDVGPRPSFTPSSTTQLSQKFVAHSAADGYGTVSKPWEEGQVVMETRIDPKGYFATIYQEDNYEQFSVSSYYGDKIPVTAGPGRTNKNYTYYRADMTLDPGWYCLTVGKDFKNDVGKTMEEDFTYWILMPYYKPNASGTSYLVNYLVDLTTNLQNIEYEDTSAANLHFDKEKEKGKVAMNYKDATCPDYLVKLTAAEGYSLPTEISVSVNGKELIPGKDYTYSSEALQTATGKDGEHEYNLKVNRHAINGPVVITAAAVKPDYVAPALVSSKGNDLIAKTYTDLELKNAPGEGYLYKFIVYNETTKQWYKLQDFSDATTISWYTGPEGVKNLYVDIKSKSDETDVTRIELTGVNVTDSNLKVETFTIVPGGELATKTQATLAATASGGEGEYQYKFIVYNSTTQQWYKLKDFGPESTFDWYTGPVGEKTLYVDVKDGTGKVVRESLSVSVQ